MMPLKTVQRMEIPQRPLEVAWKKELRSRWKELVFRSFKPEIIDITDGNFRRGFSKVARQLFPIFYGNNILYSKINNN